MVPGCLLYETLPRADGARVAPTLPRPVTDPRGPAAPGPLEARLEGWLRPWLVDERDVVFLRTTFEVLTRVLPAAVLIFALPGPWALAAGLLYVPWVFAAYTGRVVLMVHQVTHRPVFKRRLRGLDRVMTHLLPLFVGLTPAAYRAHHVTMHHVQNNGLDDLSSTVAYRRDAPLHFLHYWARFAIFGYFHLTSWLVRQGRGREAARILALEALTFAGFGLAAWWNPAAAFVVFVLPFLLLRFFLMAGNWSEHTFVDADAPTDSWRNSTILLNTPYNHRCYNAGYHLLHHLKPGLHWADAVGRFEADLRKYADHDAIVFDGVRNNQQIFWKVMTGDWGFLADRLVDLGGRRPDREARIAFLQARVRGRSGRIKGLLERVELAPPA